MADRINLQMADNLVDNITSFEDELETLINDVNVSDEELNKKFSLRLLFQNEQPPCIISGRNIKSLIDCLKRMNFLDFHDCRALAKTDDDYYGICIFTMEPFKTRKIDIESGDIFLANTDTKGAKFVVGRGNTAHHQTLQKIFDGKNLRREHICMGFAQHNKWLIGRSGTFNSNLFTNILPLSNVEKKKEGLFIFRVLVYGSVIMYKLTERPTITPYASAMAICLFLLEAKVSTEKQKQRLPVKDICIDYAEVFMTQMFLGLDIHPTILALLYQNKIRGKVICEALNLLFNELCSNAEDFNANQYETMLNELKKWVGNEDNDTSIDLHKLIESSENKYATRNANRRYEYNGRDINLNEWLEKLQTGWIYSGETYKSLDYNGVCDRCDKNDLSYQFVIRNEYIQNVKLIGSECIKRFNFSVIDTEQKPPSKTHGIEIHKRRLIALVTLERAQKKEDQTEQININDYIGSAIKHDGFIPEMIQILSGKLKKYGITHMPEDFKMLFNKQQYKDDIIDMKNNKKEIFEQILPYMTKQQKDIIGV